MATSAVTTDDELYWLALHLAPGLGTRKAGKLIEVFRTPQAVMRASRSELEAAGISGTVAQSIASGCSFEEAADQQQKMRQAQTEVIPIRDPRYPALLREIFDPPVVLFARGRTELLSSAILGVVGTRRPTPYGNAVGERLAGDLSIAGLTIASGMARGIDTAAHRATLAAGGNTIAVLGCGVDIVYPSENRKLATEIASRGLILSDFPMGSSA
ncbi:MAG: DNA-processing protein DprA, partial [Bryobacteraceae bacterium]